jgi:regulator of sirC expression with transglutaminase-like and TPR domain
MAPFQPYRCLTLEIDAAAVESVVMFTPILAAGALVVSSTFSYPQCLKKSERYPEDALEMAMNALVDGGDPLAEHCAAVALVGLKQYEEAARRLDALARKGSAGDSEMRAEILNQAGNAWLLAGQAEFAAASFTAAVVLMPGESLHLIDRARAWAAQKKWAQAETDLSAALVAEPGNVEALVLRSSARRAMKNLQGARGDITQALILEPENVEALAERGLIRAASGDRAGARQDFLKVLEKAPNGPAAASARREIERLEVKKGR